MKVLKVILKVKLLIALSGLVVFGLTRALAGETSSVWTGAGKVYDAKLNPLGAYKLKVESAKTAATERKTKVTVTLESGGAQVYNCTHTDGAKGWKSVCDNGNGGGFCLDDLCQTYTEDENGRAFATTLIFDSEDEMRLMRTELQNGKPVRFFKEKISRARQ
ncbi:MAG: hypothetical protein ABL958_18820 [Bdellovibrionia bacterium]